MMRIKRRELVSWMSLGTAIATVIGFNQTRSLSSEKKTETKAKPESTLSEGFQAVGSLEQLEENGVLINENLRVVVLQGVLGDLIALEQTCPHQGCAVLPTEERKRLICPCHGSQFTIRGKLLRGPAKTDLETYEVKAEDKQVLVKLNH
ncbi:QcrA and Rieske domain-containing protein [Dactylococcopsis salina]|jgi:cytochrome b6-f complex iron-sulfur subunit|nr:Rieske (2Fe-2S) protein [Dactylococcopsis salina]